jgi:phage terminase small subunit
MQEQAGKRGLHAATEPNAKCGRFHCEMHLRRFCYAYLLNGFNAKEAAYHIGDKKNYANAHYTRYLKHPFVQNFIREHTQKMEQIIEVNLAWKIQKLKKIIDICIPDTAKSRNDLYTKGAIAAISELNKMQGHYAPERSISSSINRELGLNMEVDDLKISEEILEELNKKYKKDY